MVSNHTGLCRLMSEIMLFAKYDGNNIVSVRRWWPSITDWWVATSNPSQYKDLVQRSPRIERYDGSCDHLAAPRTQKLTCVHINTLRPRQDGCQFPGDIFKCIFLNENISISIAILLKFVPKGPINNIPALVQIMAWRRLGDKPLSETMMVSLLTYICVTRPQWVKRRKLKNMWRFSWWNCNIAGEIISCHDLWCPGYQ